MPVNQTDLALNLCTRLQSAAEGIMKGIEDIDRIKNQKESAGVDLTDEDVETALAGSSLKHADGESFNSVLTSGAAIKAWMEANFHDDNLQKVRSGGVS